MDRAGVVPRSGISLRSKRSVIQGNMWTRGESDPLPLQCECSALPGELLARRWRAGANAAPSQTRLARLTCRITNCANGPLQIYKSTNLQIYKSTNPPNIQIDLIQSVNELNYLFADLRICLFVYLLYVDPRGIGPLSTPCHGVVLPVYYGPG